MAIGLLITGMGAGTSDRLPGGERPGGGRHVGPDLTERAFSWKGDEAVERMRQVYDKRRKLMVELKLKVGFGIPVMPQGTFYVFADASRWTDDSYAFAFELLGKAGVGVAPGVGFGQAGKRSVRFSCASSEDQPIWTKKEYGSFILDLEFKTAEGIDSGAIVHASDTKDWISNAVEVQIADDFAKECAEKPIDRWPTSPLSQSFNSGWT